MPSDQTSPNIVCAIASYGALLRPDTTRREARIPSADELPPDIAWYPDERLGTIPAVVVISGILTAIGESMSGSDVIRTAQWAICHGPSNDHTRERMSRQDIRDAVQAVIDFLARIDPMLPRGTTFRVAFAVPKALSGIAGENYFDVTFDADTAFKRVNRLRPHMYNPWADAARVAAIENKIGGLLRIPVMRLWKSWTSDANVRMLLQHVPMEEHRTEFRHGDVQRVIRARLSPEMQRTMFVGNIPPNLLGDATESEDVEAEPAERWITPAGAATVIGIVAVFAAIYFLT